MEKYIIRQFEKKDLEDFLNLYSVVFDKKGTEEWFDWKYRSNPYVDHVPIFIAEKNGTVVGARAFFPLGMTDTLGDWVAIQPCDTMVHPNYRRQGLFTKMTQRALEYYNNNERSDFVFNFPNDNSRRGNLNMDWKSVDIIDRRFRFNHFARTIHTQTDQEPIRIVGSLLNPPVRIYNKISDWLSLQSIDSGLETETENGVATNTFFELYESVSFDKIHANRSKRFYQWRFANPTRRYRSIIVRRNGSPVAGAIVGVSNRESLTHARITEIQPLDTIKKSESDALLSRILDEYSDADVISVFGRSLPTAASWGFLSDQRFPLSKVRSSIHLLTRPVNLQAGWSLEGHKLLDPSEWALSYTELDTS